MNKFQIIGLLSLLLMIWSCDKVENPYEKISGGFDSSACSDSIVFPQNTNTLRNVLVEEFTGHTCGNCPSGAYDLKQYKQLYGEQLIYIAVHAGGFSHTEEGTGKFYTDFTCDEGITINNDFQILYYPTAMINRSDSAHNSQNKVVFQQDWNTAIANFTNSTPLINLQAITSYDNTSRKLCIYTETEVLNTIVGNYNLVIAIVEDSIVDWQKNYAVPNGSPEYPAGDNANYIHKKVLRGHVNGTYGETIISGGSLNGNKYLKKHTTEISSNWNDNHLYLVIYVYDEASKEVIQVIEKKI